MGTSVSSVCKRIAPTCFFVKKQTNDKLPFARRANGKGIKKNRPGFCFLFDINMSPAPCLHIHDSVSPCFHVSISSCFYVSMSMSPSPCLHVFKFFGIRKRINGKRINGKRINGKRINGKRKLPLFSANGKRKIDVCLP